MKKIISIFLVIFGVLMLTFGTSSARRLQEMKTRTGSALYSNYRGVVTITEVKKTEKSKAQAKVAGRNEGYEVWFTFEPDKEEELEVDEGGKVEEVIKEEAVEEEVIKEKWGRRFVVGEHLFKLATGLYPNAKYIKKYKIKPGQTYRCTFRVMKQGRGTPFIFVIDGLPKDDVYN